VCVVQPTEAQESTVGSAGRGIAIYAPKPDYSFEARSHWLEGRGVFALNVRPDGIVDNVEVEKSTGHSELDQSAITASRQWRFKPGLVAPKIKIPMEFTLAGLRPAGIDAALRAEKKGSKPPSGKSSWQEYWDGCISGWNAYHRLDYEIYFRMRRKELGLPDFNKL
jgi:TonB family protein